jgi:hypothetical protein
MIKSFLIAARTGCTCCSSENFCQGPYTDKSRAEAIIAEWQKGNGNPLSSQYSRFGNYSIEEHDAEEISGGRFIINDKVWGPEIERKLCYLL